MDDDLNKKFEPTIRYDLAGGDIKKQKSCRSQAETIKEICTKRKDVTDGCAYAMRCPKAEGHCFTDVPVLKSCSSHKVACFLSDIIGK